MALSAHPPAPPERLEKDIPFTEVDCEPPALLLLFLLYQRCVPIHCVIVFAICKFTRTQVEGNSINSIITVLSANPITSFLIFLAIFYFACLKKERKRNGELNNYWTHT